MHNAVPDAWAAGGPYERFMGRWSRSVADRFLPWLDLPPGQPWGEVGCGTGALTARILAAARPHTLLAVDRSVGLLTATQAAVGNQAQLAVADAAALPWQSGACTVVVAGLVLNFVPDAVAALREMARVCRPGGRVAVYVWDYARGMELLRCFWDVAVAVVPAAAALDEGRRFPLCQPEPLHAAFAAAGLTGVTVEPIVIPTVFTSFEDYWEPFLGRQGPAPSFLASLAPELQEQIRVTLAARLPAAPDGAIALAARAWAVQATVPTGR